MIIQRGPYLKTVRVWCVVASLGVDIPVVALHFSDVGLLAVVIRAYISLRNKNIQIHILSDKLYHSGMQSASLNVH